MGYLSNNFFNKINSLITGQYLFLIGIFFLPSTLFISLFFLLPAAVLGTIKNNESYLNDNWSKSFFLCGILMTFSSILQKFFIENNYSNIWDPNLSIIGLSNWLPFFWLFWALQPYLKTKKQRNITALAIVSGTFPVLISGFGQYFFKWHGPFEIWNGLIIWYQRPIEYPAGLSGLFNNQNYAGSWINFAWPFSIAFVIDKSQKFIKKVFAINFLLSIGLAAFLTNSRNAWAGILISLPIVIGLESFFWLIPLFTLIIILILFCTSDYLSGDIQNFLRSIIPQQVWMEFSEEGFKDIDVSRIEILKSAILLLLKNPLFGIGAASFSAIYAYQTGFWKGHSHNLIIEFAISYGIPATIIILITISSILFLSGKKIFLNQRLINKKDFYERAWWCSTFYFLISQLADIQYFDGKISILFWVLLAGLKNILNQPKSYDLVN